MKRGKDMKNIIMLSMLLPLSICASEYIGLEAPSQTITIKNNSQLKAMIYYINDDGQHSWVTLRPTRKCALFARWNPSITITFLTNDKIQVWFPKINKEL